MHNGPFQEGRAAAIVHGRTELNPYKAAANIEAIFAEYMRDWDSGFVSAPHQLDVGEVKRQNWLAARNRS